MEPVSLTLVFSALLAGVLMFLAPCTLPLVPAFLAYLSGTAGTDVPAAERRRRLLSYTLLYCLGFSVVFITLGVLAGLVGGVFATYQILLMQLSGVFVIVIGVSLTGVLARMGWGTSTVQGLPLPPTASYPVAFGLGVAFAFAWTPCIGPVLATILLYASTTGTAVTGAFLLSVFSLGLTIPFVFTALFFERALTLLPRASAVLTRCNQLAGWLLVVLGVLLLTNSIGFVFDAGYWLFAILGLDVLYQFF
jgi:cytochrome c-type biogenesis protein